MKIRVQLVVGDDDGHEATVTDVTLLQKACQRFEHLGLTLPEVKPSLAALQQRFVELPSSAFVAPRSQGEPWGKPLGIHGHHSYRQRSSASTACQARPAAARPTSTAALAAGVSPPPQGSDSGARATAIAVRDPREHGLRASAGQFLFGSTPSAGGDSDALV